MEINGKIKLMRAGFEFFRRIFEYTIFLVIDLISIHLFFKLSVFIRVELFPQFLSLRFPHVPERGLFMPLWVPCVWFFFMFYEGLYGKRFSFWDELRALWKVSVLSTIGVFTIIALGKFSAEVSRIVIIIMGFISILFFPVIRQNLRRLLLSAGLLIRNRALILGSQDNAMVLLSALRKEKNYGYEIVGFVDDTDVKEIEGIRVYNGINNILNYIDSLDVKYIFITIPEIVC